MRFCQFHPIFTSLSPNTEKDDIWLALKLIFQPWKWYLEIRRFCHPERSEGSRGLRALNLGFFRLRPQNDKKGNVCILEEEFKRYLQIKYAFAFNSGRSAFLAILNALELEQESEILLQAFTCNAVVNPILWSGLKPVYVDIESETLNIDSSDLEKKITNKSRGVVVQHTFGLAADLDKILEICKKHGSTGSPQGNLILIEDCAHSLGATRLCAEERPRHGKKVGLSAEAQGMKVGTFGKASFFSFGRDKIISSVYGGMATTNDDELAKKIKEFQEKCNYPSYFWILQQLLHPVLTNFLVIPLYSFLGLGKWVLLALQKLKILSKAVHKKEKQGRQPHYIPQKMPNVLAILALNQFKKLERFISHQKQIADFYNKNLSNVTSSELVTLPTVEKGRIYMRYSILVGNKNTDEILKKLRRQKIFLDDGWRKTPIMPPDTNQEKMGYVLESCPVAEKVAKNILNLPTHINISKQKAIRIIDFLKEVL